MKSFVEILIKLYIFFFHTYKSSIIDVLMRPKKPTKVSAIPPILKNIFGFKNEKTIPCINLPTVNATPEK